MSGVDEVEEELVGRCYTKARRLPLVLGELNGFRLWGGPYTVPQLVTIVVVAGLMLLAHPLWAHFGLFNAVLLLGVPYGLSFVVRQLRVEGRSPFAALASSAGLLVSPSQGRLAGRPLVSRVRRRVLSGACTVTWQEPRVVVPRRAGAVVAAALSPEVVERGAPAVLSGAQALRARAGAVSR